MINWHDIKPGILTDYEIKMLCPSMLIKINYDPAFVKQACYELRVGELVWYTYIRDPKLRKVSIKDQGGVYLHPKGYATIITMEQLDLPADCIGKIMTKGQLFSIGISEVNTYADPGFSGPLGITLINHSSKPIFIPIGEAIAKIEFIKLNETVKDSYKGPHLKAGNLWPIPDSYFNIPTNIDAKIYSKDLKDPFIEEIEDRISKAKNEIDKKKYAIRSLFIIIVPLIISSILYWISNWATMSKLAKSLFISISSLTFFLATIVYRWKSIWDFINKFRS